MAVWAAYVDEWCVVSLHGHSTGSSQLSRVAEVFRNLADDAKRVSEVRWDPLDDAKQPWLLRAEQRSSKHLAHTKMTQSIKQGANYRETLSTFMTKLYCQIKA